MTAQTKPHVFLSHNSDDKPFVEDLARRLRKEGLEPWLDKWNLIPGQTYQPAIEEALDQCECCAVFVGPSGVGPWQNEEMRVAIARRIEDKSRKLRVIPVLLPGAERGKRSNLPSFLVATTWVEFRQSLDEPDQFHRLQCGIRGIEPGAGPDGAIYEGQCPYRGLQFFDVEHAPFFHGRESLTDWLLDALSPAKKTPTRFLAILGASGSGKSSLARAGLVARLKKEGLPGSSTWPIAICRPGPNPLESLVTAVAKNGIIKADVAAVSGLVTEMTRSDTALHLAINLALPDDPAARAVILVDQFEELFTLGATDELRQAFLRNLLHAATVSQGRTMVVLTMRADFLSKCAPYAELAAAVSDNQMLVGPMTEDELRIAIERPAQMVGLELEPGLTDMLMREVSEQPGALPLLQHALMELWRSRDGRRMTVAAYNAFGGMGGALQKRANATLDAMSPEQREIAKQIFLRLTTLGEGVSDTRRRLHRDELYPDQADRAAIDTVLDKLRDKDACLIVTNDGTVEVTHEALIQQWDELKKWLNENRDAKRLCDRLRPLVER